MTKQNLNRFSDRLHLLLKKHNMTYSQLAQDTGIKTSTISMWNRGTITPKSETLIKLAEYFHVTPGYLMGAGPDDYESNYVPGNSEARNQIARFSGDTEADPPPHFTVPTSSDIKRESDKLHSNSGSVNEEYLDDLKFNGIIQKLKRGAQLTAEEQTFYDAYLERGLRRALETAIKFYFMLNDDGKKKADAQITQFIEQLELLTKVPEYQKDTDNADK